MSLQFGTDEMFGYLHRQIGERYGTGWYDRVYRAIADDCRAVLRNRYGCRVSSYHIDIIVSDVQYKIFSDLRGYLNRRYEGGETGRCRFFAQLILNTAADYFRREVRNGVPVENLPEPAGWDVTAHGRPPDVQRALEAREALHGALREVLSLPGPPEDLIAFLMNKYYAFVQGNDRRGNPAAVAKTLDGLTLWEAFGLLRQTLCREFDGGLPEEVFTPLEEKLQRRDPSTGAAAGERPFTLSGQKLIHRVSRVAEAVRRTAACA